MVPRGSSMGHNAARTEARLATVRDTHDTELLSMACWLSILIQCTASFWLIIEAWVTVVSWIWSQNVDKNQYLNRILLQHEMTSIIDLPFWDLAGEKAGTRRTQRAIPVYRRISKKKKCAQFAHTWTLQSKETCELNRIASHRRKRMTWWGWGHDR
jgi:hypothetical protein